jgi:hypothetical protein
VWGSWLFLDLKWAALNYHAGWPVRCLRGRTSCIWGVIQGHEIDSMGSSAPITIVMSEHPWHDRPFLHSHIQFLQ